MYNVVVRIDDILIAGRTQAEHFQSLEEVLSQLEKAGIRLKRWKCIASLEMVFIHSKRKRMLFKIHLDQPI